MKTIFLNLSLGAIFCSSAMCEEELGRIKDATLSAMIEKANFEAKDSSISLDLVLRNNSSKAIIIAERWNSWGAFQWTVNVTTADHRVIEFINPQIVWKRNFLSAANIEPGKQLRLHCRLFSKQPTLQQDGIEVFTSKDKNLSYTFPVHIVGTFAARLHSDGRVTTNWEGAIKTSEVELKR